MTNHNERLDEILAEFVDGCDCRIDEGQAYLHQSEFAADKAKQAIVEWHEIEKSEVYNSGCSDTAKHILALFDNQIPEQLKQWLRLEIEDRGKL